MDNRAYAAGYAWSRDVEGAPERTWEFRSAQITLPTGAVKELRHSGYHCLLAKWDEVKDAHVERQAQPAATAGIEEPVNG